MTNLEAEKWVATTKIQCRIEEIKHCLQILDMDPSWKEIQREKELVALKYYEDKLKENK